MASWTALLLLLGTGVARAAPQDFFLHGTGPDNNPPTLLLNTTAPTAASAKFRDSAGVNFSGGNPWKEVGTWPADPTLTAGTLSAVSDLHVWGGLKNSDDQGTNFDLRAEVFKNGALVASGLTRCITGLTRPAANAQEVTVAFGSFPPAVFNGTADTLSLTLSTRIGTNPDNSKCVPGHQNAVGLRVYFDATDRPARLGATFGAPPPGPLTQARAGHTASLLPSGSVLLAGGNGTTGILNSAEVFDSVALTATPLTSTLTSARTEHSITVLPQTETLLIAGQDSLGPLFSTEMFTPGTQTFRALSANVQTLRAGQTASLLLDGRVLITGGQHSGALSSVEAFNAQTVVIFKPGYDPEQGIFTGLPNGLNTARWDHTATTLADGRILLTGGRTDTGVLASAELFDPIAEEFTLLSASLTTPRAGHTGTLLPDGRVLLLGGDSGAGALATAEVFTPSTGTFTALTPGLTTARVNHTATWLPTGFVLITGGQNSGGLLASTELYTSVPADTMAPIVSAVSPANGATGVDRTELLAVRFSEPVDVRTLTTTSVTLTGGGGPVAATLSPGESGLMVFLVPAAPLSPGTTYTLSLTTAIKDTAGNPLTAVTSQFTTVAAPTITGFNPTSGTPGTTVTITGTNFDPVASKNEVTFNGALATVTAASTTSLTATVPSGATTGPITVATRGGLATSATNFTVITGPAITSFTPTSGPAGTSVMISGQNFDAVASSNQVKFNGISAIITSASSTTITTTVPQGAATGVITVTTPLGTATSAQPFTVTLVQNFTLSTLPTPLVVAASGQGAFAVSVAGTGGYANSTTLAVTGVPSGAAATFSAPTLTAGQSDFLTVVTNGTTPAGTYPLTVTGTGLVGGVSTARSSTVAVQILAAGLTTFAGQVLDEEDKPVTGALVTMGTVQVTTDASGNFLMQNPPVGVDQLFFIDGGPASTPGRNLPIIPYKGTIVAGQANVLGFTPKLHFQKTTGLVDISNSGVQRIVTDPDLPGYQMTIPVGATIIGWDGQPNTQVSIRRVPLDRNPLPPVPTDRVVANIYMDYFGKPGGGTPSEPIPITLPNDLDLPPGTQEVELWFYDEAPDGSRPNQWAQYGTGTVSADGTQVIPDINPATGKPYGQPRFCCGGIFLAYLLRLMNLVNSLANGQPEIPGATSNGDPVSLGTGAFTLTKTDLVLPGRLPVTFTRRYRTNGPTAGPFGPGTSHPYQVLLRFEGNVRTLLLPEGARIQFRLQTDGTFRNFTEPAVRGAVYSETSGLVLRFKDGAAWTFGSPVQNVSFLISQRDRNGNTITLTRSGLAQQNVTTITAPDGRQLTLSYDGGDRIVQITDPIGRTVQYSYDAGGRLINVIDPAGGVTRYTYDSAGLLLTITDPRDLTYLTNQYSPGSGRVLQQTLADGGIWRFRYQLSGAQVTGPGCPAVSGSLVVAVRVAVAVVCPSEESTEQVAQGYTFVGGVVTATTVVDPRGKVSTYRFNGLGHLLSQTDALGQGTTTTRDGGNQATASTDPLGRKTTFTYDTAGNVLTITDPDNKVTSFEYEPTFNRVKKITDALNQVTEFTYDPANGNLLTTKDPLNHVTTIAYNQFGQPISVQGPIPTEPPTTFAYDTDGNLITTTDPLGNQTQHTYDAVSRLTALTDPRGLITQFRHDNLNRVTEIADARNGLTRFGYDPNGNLLSVTDAKNQTTTYTYDPMDRLATRKDALNRQESYQYDPAGNLSQFTDRKNQPSTFSYDALNRRTNAGYADGSSTTFTYDSVGRLAVAEDSLSGRIEFAYDTLDRLIKELSPQGVVNYGYDALGRRTTMTANGQAPVGYQYDAASRLIQVAQGSQIVGLGYDATGRRTSLTYPNATNTNYTYDNASRLTSIVHNGPSGLIEALSYGYDAAGNRISLARTNGTASLLPQAVQAAYDVANEQIQFNAASPNQTFDANGNLQTQTDASGTTTYTWDARNRLVAITGPSLSASFSYDALGRRISKTINGVATQFLYDGNDIVAEVGGGVVGATYIRSLNIDEPFINQTASGNEHFHTDALGSTLRLTNQTGAVQTTYSYEAFGKTTMTGASSNPFQFTGRENDGTGVQNHRARYYAPSFQRFISEESMVSLAVSPCLRVGGIKVNLNASRVLPATDPLLLNLYQYAKNNPVLFVDINGLEVQAPPGYFCDPCPKKQEVARVYKMASCEEPTEGLIGESPSTRQYCSAFPCRGCYYKCTDQNGYPKELLTGKPCKRFG